MSGAVASATMETTERRRSSGAVASWHGLTVRVRSVSLRCTALRVVLLRPTRGGGGVTGGVHDEQRG